MTSRSQIGAKSKLYYQMVVLIEWNIAIADGNLIIISIKSTGYDANKCRHFSTFRHPIIRRKEEELISYLGG